MKHQHIAVAGLLGALALAGCHNKDLDAPPPPPAPSVDAPAASAAADRNILTDGAGMVKDAKKAGDNIGKAAQDAKDDIDKQTGDAPKAEASAK